ncbi:hypothetical protein INR49_023384 [Caranx melampygus]|nr:hypothetical protein INR49_023384 [Caranx melampygus]
MSTGKVAACVGLGVGAVLVMQGGEDPLGPERSGSPSWIESGVLGAPTRAVVFVAVVSLLAMGWLYRLLFCPLELFRALEDVGYIAEDGRSRARAANEVRRRRKTGELPPVYPNGWYRVLSSHQLERGEVKNVTALGEQVAVFRGQDGKAYVVDAYCPHLGANLAVGGRVVGSCIECPFHGWQFRGDNGNCAKIPYTEKVPEFARVRCWPTCEVNSQILEIPENAADTAHLAHLHTPGIVSGVDLRYTNSKMWEFVRHDWKVQWEPESEPNKHCSQMLVNHTLTVFGHHFPLLDVHVVARQVGPGVVFLLFHHSFLGRGVIIQCVTPVEPLLQCVSHTIFYQSNIPPLPGCSGSVRSVCSDGSSRHECPICSEPLDSHKDGCITLLHCNHTLCHRCTAGIMRQAKDPGRLRCPLCRQTTPFPQWEIRRLQEESYFTSVYQPAQALVISPGPELQAVPSSPWCCPALERQLEAHTHRNIYLEIVSSELN